MKSFRKYILVINIFLLSAFSTGIVVNNFEMNNISKCFVNQEISENCCCCSDKNDGCCCCNSEANEYDVHKCICNIESQNENQEESPVNATVQKNINLELLFSIIGNQNTGTINSEEKESYNKSGTFILNASSNLYIQNSNLRI